MLSSRARSYLRGIGNELTPVLTVGRGGLGPEIVKQLDGVLETRELVKGRLLPQDDPQLTAREAAETLALQTQADVVQVVGNNFLLYRRSRKKPRLELPD